MHQFLRNVVIGAAVAIATSAQAATQQDYDDCQQTSDADRGIAACTRIVGDASESAADRAAMYIRRGYDYLTKSDFDNAIADDSEAIKIEPRNAYGFANRAIAYARQGDRDRAIADYVQANRLDPATVAGNRELMEIGDLAARVAKLQNSAFLDDRLRNASDREAYRYYAFLARTPAPAPPANVPAWVRAATPALMPSQAIQEAVALIQHELMTNHDAEGWLTLARVHAGLGDKDAAAHEFEQAIAQDNSRPYRTHIILAEIFADDPKVSTAIDDYVATLPPPPPPLSKGASEDERTRISNLASGREDTLARVATLLSLTGDTARANRLLVEAKNIEDSFSHQNAAGLVADFWLAGNGPSAWQILRNMAFAGQANYPYHAIPKELRSTLDGVLCGPYADYLENVSGSFRAVSDDWRRSHPSDDSSALEHWRFKLEEAVRLELACDMHERAARALNTLLEFNKTRPPAWTRNFLEENKMNLRKYKAELDGEPPPIDVGDPNHPELDMIIERALRAGNYQAAIEAARDSPSARRAIVKVAAAADRFDIVRQVIAIERFPYFHAPLATEALKATAHLPTLPF